MTHFNLRSKLILYSLFWLCLFCGESTSAAKAENLSLEQAIDRAILKNNESIAAALNIKLTKMNFTETWQNFYLPQITLSAGAVSEYTFHILKDSPAATQGAIRDKGAPRARVDLNIGEYTLFNSWRDKFQFDLSKLDYLREQKRYDEFIKALKNRIISTYYQMSLNQKKLEVAQFSVKTAQAVVGLIRSRKGLSSNQDDIDSESANIDLNDAKQELNSVKEQFVGGSWQLNLLLGDPINTKYNLTSEFTYQPIGRIVPTEIFKQFLKTGPSYIDSKNELIRKDTELLITQMSRLPLPTITFSGLSLSYSQNSLKSSSEFSTSNGGKMNISAGMQLSLPILASGGFLHSRTMQQVKISKEITRIQHQFLKNDSLREILTRIKELDSVEKNIQLSKRSLDSSIKLLNSIVSGGLNNINRLELRDALSRARNAQFGYYDLLLQHRNSKQDLESYIGVSL